MDLWIQSFKEAGNDSMSWLSIKSAYVFYAVAALLLGYLLFTMIRPRKGERPESGRGELEEL